MILKTIVSVALVMVAQGYAMEKDFSFPPSNWREAVNFINEQDNECFTAYNVGLTTGQSMVGTYCKQGPMKGSITCSCSTKCKNTSSHETFSLPADYFYYFKNLYKERQKINKQ